MKTQRNNHRTRFEIVNIILNKVKKRKTLGVPKTKLIQESNLSPMGFIEYYNRLIASKLITENKTPWVRGGSNGKARSPRVKIFITELGETYLKKSNLLCLKIEKLNKEYELDLNEISYSH